MREQFLKLRELQEVDLEIDARKQALAALDNGDAAKARIAELTAQLNAASEKRQKLDTQYFDHDLELKSKEAKKKKAEDLMYSGKVSNLKELDDLQKEVAMFNREIDRLSTNVLELMDEVETSRNAEKEIKTELQSVEEQLATIQEKLRKKQRSIA